MSQPNNRKVDFALAFLNSIRKEKNPPIGRYCMVLAIAASPSGVITSAQLTRTIGGDAPLSGTIESAVRQGVVECLPTTPRSYRLSSSGEAIAARLLNPHPEPITS